MHALRDNWVKRLTAVIAGLALYLQLAFAGPGTLALAAPGDPVTALAEHALCLAAQTGNAQQQPADNSPATPAHDHDHALFCCLWHAQPWVASQAALAPLPVAYAPVAHVEWGDSPLIPGPHRGPANARAPPALA